VNPDVITVDMLIRRADEELVEAASKYQGRLRAGEDCQAVVDAAIVCIWLREQRKKRKP